jgi:hypothetical protein
MKYTSTILAAASGSIAGATFSRNRGGQYIRRRAIPSNPNSEAQGFARTNLAAAVSAWTNLLTDPQRQAWQTYAQATPVIDPLGQQITLSGQQMFVRSRTVALIGGLTMDNDAPGDSGLGDPPTFGAALTVDASTQLVVTTATTGVLDAGNFALMYMSRPVPASRIPNHETKRFVISEEYAAGDAALSGTVPFPVTTGQRVRVTLRNFDVQNRVSAIAFQDVVVQA